MERRAQGKCEPKRSKPDDLETGETGTGKKASGRPAPGWVVSWEGGSSPLPLSWTVLARRQGQGSGQPASGWRTEGLCAQAAPCGQSPCGREGQLALPVSSQPWPGEPQDRAHPMKPPTRRVYSLDGVRGTYPRHPSLQRLPQPPAASSSGCKELGDLQVTPPMAKSQKGPQDSGFAAGVVVYTYNPRYSLHKAGGLSQV